MLVVDDDGVVVLRVRIDRCLLAGEAGGERALLRVQSFVLDLDRLLDELLNLRRETLEKVAREVARLVRRERLLQRQILQDVAGDRRSTSTPDRTCRSP